MKIVFIGTLSSSILGFRAPFIRELKKRGHTIYACAIDYDETSRNQVTHLGAIPLDYKMNRGGLNPFELFLSVMQLVRILIRLKPDMVFSYFVKPVIYGTIAGKIAGVKKRIVLIEGLGSAFTPSPNGQTSKLKLIKYIQIFLYKLSLPLATNVIFLNADDPIDLIDSNKIHIKKSFILGGIGLDLDQFQKTEPSIDPVTFIFVGRLLAEKGVFDFIEAAKLVKATQKKSRFIILGGVDKGNPSSVDPNMLHKLIVDGVIEYPGSVNNVYSWLSKASVFVLPSYYREGVPRSIQEAMAAGLPIITTNVPGCRDTVEHGNNGFLVEPWNSAQLAERMTWFIENSDQIKPMGSASHTLAKNRYDVRFVNSRLLNELEL